MADRYRFGAVIPAAGLSSRMGAFKPLLPCGSSTVIETAINSVLPYASTAVAVIGHQGEKLRSVLTSSFNDKLTIVTNPDYASTDMLRSVQLGLRAIEGCGAFFLLPADMPLIKPRVYEALIAAFDDSADVIYPVFDGRRGHPPLISCSVVPAIMEYRGGGGLRAILNSRVTKEVIISESGILTDLDTPQDYEAIKP
ncbi:nucleotidyltransferase family protein [Ruminococcus sp.]|uniref:nucleotidyltransferase family protein n=1 Tax=Ruminococcus sp. TaxID=41978 RepID=UPI002E808DA6|nr:nucleotidyltransferase family protein [Ruminococcus sp.]MEE3493369.1 nucleotidyltransferase family protein [Ruminococcus sp.]